MWQGTVGYAQLEVSREARVVCWKCDERYEWRRGQTAHQTLVALAAAWHDKPPRELDIIAHSS